jgi:hypothetical protein
MPRTLTVRAVRHVLAATADYLARLIDLGVLPPDMDREGRMLVRRMRNMIARMPKRSQPKP